MIFLHNQHEAQLRITFVLPKLSMAGGIRVIAIYANFLQKRGHDVKVVCVENAKPPFLRRVKDILKGRGFTRHVRRLPSYFDSIDIDLTVYKKYSAIGDNNIPDADVIVATYWDTAQVVADLSLSKGVKVYFMQDYGAPGQELEKIIPTWKLPLHKITISQWLVNLINSHAGDEKVDLVPNAVDFESFSAEPRDKQLVPTAGFVFRKTPSKGVDIVFEAYLEVLKTRPDFRLIAFGSEPPPDFTAGHFEYFLLPPDDKLIDLYSCCDMWVFPSRIEGFGLPIMEAMACRTPVIATPAGAAPELLENGGGILLEGFQPSQMASAMLQFVNMSSDRWKVMSEKARLSVSGYSWENAAGLFEQMLVKACKEK